MKIEYLENVAQAKKNIIIWFSSIEQTNNGNKMFSNENNQKIYYDHFNEWYNDEGQTFSSFESFRAIEKPYKKMFALYSDYNELYKKPIKRSFFFRNEEKRDFNLKTIFKELLTSKNELIDHITFFENNLKNSQLFKNISVKNTSSETSKEELNFTLENSNSKELNNQILNIDKDNSITNKKPIKTEENTVIKEKLSIKKEKMEQPKNNPNPDIDIEEEIRRILS